MTTFLYNAVTTAGESVDGRQKAKDEGTLRQNLIDSGLTVRSIKAHKSIWQFEITKKKVPANDLMHFSRQLGAFVKAGIPILDAIDIIATEATNKTLKEALKVISADIASGKGLSDAAAQHPNVFPDFYVRTLRSAELTGKLDVVLRQLSTYIERDQDAKRKIQSAMIYPAIVIVLAIGVVILLMSFVLPRFKTFFGEFHAKLPLPTRMLLAVGNFFTDNWLALVVAVVSIIVVLFASQQARGGRYLRDSLLLRLPVIGDVVQFAIVERFCRVLSSLMQAAVSIPEALEVAIQGTNNLVFEDALGKARVRMVEGGGLSRPIADTKLFPATITQMMRVGEETGTLDEQLQTAAEFFEVELGYKIKRFTTLIEPAVILVIGVIVGFVAIALVSAMYGVYHQVKY